MADRGGVWTDICVKDLFRTRFFYREVVVNGKTNAAKHFVNLILPCLKRSDPEKTSTEAECARLLRLFLLEMDRKYENVSSEIKEIGEGGWIMKLRRTPGYRTAQTLMNPAKDGCMQPVKTQYRGFEIKPVMYAEFINPADVIWTPTVDKVVHASVRRALSRVSAMFEKQHAVADSWLRVSGLGSDSALAKYRATCRGVSRGFQVYGRTGPHHPSERRLREWESITKNLACSGEIPTFCSMAGSITLEANRGRRTMTKDSGPVDIDRIIFLNHMELYMEKEHLTDVDSCSKAVLKFMVDDYDGKEMFFGLEHTSDGRRLDYRCILKPYAVCDSASIKLVKAMVLRMRSQFFPARMYYFSNRTMVVAQVNEIRLAVWKLLQGVPEHKQPLYPKTAVVACLFWLDNKGVKGRLAMRLVENGQALLFEDGVSPAVSVISYLGSERDIQGFKNVWTFLMNEVASNSLFKYEQRGYVYVRLGLVVADHLACWNLLGVPQKPSSYSDCFGLTDLSCSFVLHQAKSHFSVAAAVAGRRAYMNKDPDAEDELDISDKDSDDGEKDQLSDCRDWSDSDDCAVKPSTGLQSLTHKQIYQMPDLTPAKIVARANYLKYFKWDPVMSTGAMFNLRSFLVVPPGLHNVVSSLCSVCCTRVPKLLPRSHPAMDDIIRQYELISGTENSSSVVANGRMYRSLTHKIAMSLVPAISADGILRSLARQDQFPNITLCLPFWAHIATVSDILIQDYYSNAYRTAAKRGVFRALSYMHFYIRALEELYQWHFEVQSWLKTSQAPSAVGEVCETAVSRGRKRPNGAGGPVKRRASKYPRPPLFSVYDVDVELHMPDLDELLRIPLCRLLEEKFEQQFIVEDLIKWQKRTGTAITIADQKRFIDDIVNDVLSYSGHGELQKDARSSIREFKPWFVAACVFCPDLWAAPGSNGLLSQNFSRCNMRNFYRRVLSLYSLKDVVLIETDFLPGIARTFAERLLFWKQARHCASTPVERLIWLCKAVVDILVDQPSVLTSAHITFLGEGSSLYHSANPLLEEKPIEVVVLNSLDSEVVGVSPARQDVIDAVRNVVPCEDCNPAKGKNCSHKSRRLFGMNNIPFQIVVLVETFVRVKKRQSFVKAMFCSAWCYEKYILPTLDVRIKRCDDRLRPDLGNILRESRQDPAAVRSSVLRPLGGKSTDKPVYDSVEDEWLPDYLFCVEPSRT